MRWSFRRSDPPARGRHAAASVGEPPRPTTLVDTSPVGSGVHLGFGDGSMLELAPGDSRTATFRALADSLAQGVR
jgi:hypothetical protein